MNYTESWLTMGIWKILIYHHEETDEYFYSLRDLLNLLAIPLNEAPKFNGTLPTHKGDFLLTPRIAAELLMSLLESGHVRGQLVLYYFLHRGLQARATIMPDDEAPFKA